jgi:hypothetical protein
MKQINLIVTVFSLAVIFSCKSQKVPEKKPEPSNSTTTQTPTFTPNQSVGPNHARVIATMVYINPVLMPGDPKDPCTKVPCKGRIRIENVLGYGQAFGNPLSVGDSLYINFAFTTAATTKDLFPVFSEYYPGLKVGDKFQADIESRLGMGGSNAVSYTIYGYKIIKN